MDPTVDEAEELHPIVKLTWRVLAGPAEPTHHRLSEALDKLVGTPELKPAVLTLVTIAQYLDELGRDDAADILLEACTTVVEGLKADTTQAAMRDQNRRRLKAETFARFQGQAVGAKAPRFGDQGKAGTVTAASLMSVRRRFA